VGLPLHENYSSVVKTKTHLFGQNLNSGAHRDSGTIWTELTTLKSSQNALMCMRSKERRRTAAECIANTR
ncbi:MAG: hypothetical protein K2W97_00750, partial [Chthoniobacterales bacterium]|nr:hypothetical protein [Chthoniobacterales bacterium]